MAKIEITKTELVWPGKFNEDGTVKEVPRVSLPFQIIKTKGRVWEGTAAKDEAIRDWCERVERATGNQWCYVRVNQADVDLQGASSLAEVVVSRQPGLALPGAYLPDSSSSRSAAPVQPWPSSLRSSDQLQGRPG